ncbi:TPA: hypothetical protein N0F65_012805 [Lagenidium giganteum]|uniref:Uncharacterized protein n=1 Tax=Lagenidium giganteum TaxID=4803 RepID=A0AAV2YEG6_9STRA|nr:TPA: hypothetical protein N0F65_012805 [Lagenidium giganteum]
MRDRGGAEPSGALVSVQLQADGAHAHASANANANTGVVGVTSAPTGAAAQDPSLRPGFRGKCLYKTGKCTNERALKTTGQAHNLCDEHRNRQNEHQRKLDAKNRHTRRDKQATKTAKRFAPYAPSSGPPPQQHEDSAGSDDSNNSNGNGNGSAAAVAAYPQSPAVIATSSASGLPDASSVSVSDRAATPTTVAMHGVATAALHAHGLPPTMVSPSAMALHGMQAMMAPPHLAATPTAVAVGPHGEMLPNSIVYVPAHALANGGQANGQATSLLPPGFPPDFDGIMVPLPSFLTPEERVEMRARINQKVMDFIAEECMLRYGTKSNDHRSQTGGVTGSVDDSGNANANANASATTRQNIPRRDSTSSTYSEASEASDRNRASKVRRFLAASEANDTRHANSRGLPELVALADQIVHSTASQRKRPKHIRVVIVHVAVAVVSVIPFQVAVKTLPQLKVWITTLPSPVVVAQGCG